MGSLNMSPVATGTSGRIVTSPPLRGVKRLKLLRAAAYQAAIYRVQITCNTLHERKRIYLVRLLGTLKKVNDLDTII